MPASPKPAKGSTKRAKARARRQEAAHAKTVYLAVDARDRFACRVCCAHKGDSIHRHHIVFRSAGGPTTTANVCHLCDECHRAVHAHRVKLTGDADGALKVKAATVYVNGVGQQWAIYASYAPGVAA